MKVLGALLGLMKHFETGFSISVPHAHTSSAIRQQVSSVGVFLFSVRSQNSTSPVERDTLCSPSLLSNLYTEGGVQVHCCPQHWVLLGVLPLHIQKH